MTSGARRGELCALRWSKVDLDIGTIVIDLSVAQVDNGTLIKTTKTTSKLGIALGSATVEIFRELRAEAEARAASVGAKLAPDSLSFPGPDSNTYLRPDSVTQRYAWNAERVGIKTHLHQLRHYSATESISAGVDIRTVAGRLGHAGGGATTLRVYTAFVSEADQRASEALKRRLPSRPRQPDAGRSGTAGPAGSVRANCQCHSRPAREWPIPAWTALPGTQTLAREYEVSASTIRRAVRLLREWGVVDEK